MKPIQFECLKCGLCCRNLIRILDGASKGLSLFSNELDLFPRDQISPNIGLGKPSEKIEFIKEYQLNTEVCPHIDEDNKCKIYTKRPLSCRRFPLIGITQWTAGVALGKDCKFIEQIERALGELNQVFTPKTFIYEEGWVSVKRISEKSDLMLIEEQLTGLQLFTFDLKYNQWIKL